MTGRQAQNEAMIDATGQSLSDVEKAVRLWEEALKASEAEVGKGTRAVQADEKTASKMEAGSLDRKWSIKNTIKLTLKEQLSAFYSGKMASSDAFYFGETPAILNDVGVDIHPLAFTISDFLKSTRKKHNIPRRVLNNLQNSLQNSLFAFESGNRLGIVTNDIDGDGKPLLIAIEKNVNMDSSIVNKIHSIYGLDNPDQWLKNQIADGKTFLIVNEKKANAFLHPYGYMASREDGIRFLDESVPQFESNVNKKFSIEIPATDSTGRELSQEQQEYFKDSQVRDDSGKLIPVYHGTAAMFNEFSFDFINTHGSSEGRGFYFTDKKSMAEGYAKDTGRVMAGYLDIHKPLSNSELTITRAEVQKLIKAIDPTGDDLLANYDPTGGMGYPTPSARRWRPV